MAKSYGIWARLRRNNRIMKAALSGSLLYALTVAVAAPLFGDAPTADNSVASHSFVATLALRPALINVAEAPQVPSPVTIVRDLVNRPAYQAYLREKDCLTTGIYFEARGESAIGQKAVAEVIIARTRVPGRPRSICGVVWPPIPRSSRPGVKKPGTLSIHPCVIESPMKTTRGALVGCSAALAAW